MNPFDLHDYFTVIQKSYHWENVGLSIDKTNELTEFFSKLKVLISDV